MPSPNCVYCGDPLSLATWNHPTFVDCIIGGRLACFDCESINPDDHEEFPMSEEEISRWHWAMAENKKISDDYGKP